MTRERRSAEPPFASLFEAVGELLNAKREERLGQEITWLPCRPRLVRIGMTTRALSPGPGRAE